MPNVVRLIAFVSLSLFIWTGTAFSQFSDQEAPLQLRTGAQTIIDGQISAFRAKQHEKAFSYAAPGIRSSFGSADSFIGMVKNGYGPIYSARNWSFGRSRLQGDKLFQEVLLTGPNGKEWLALYTLNKQPDGSWKIAGVQMKQGAGQTT